MGLSWILTVLVAVVATRSDCASLPHGRLLQSSGRATHHFTEGLPPCNYYSDYKTLFCQYLDATGTSLLEQSLLITSQAIPPSSLFNVEIVYSEGRSIPVDLFQGYLIQGLILGSNGFTSMPYNLLSSLGPSLTSLAIEDEVGITTLTAPTEVLPFSDSLEVLIFGNIAIGSIESGTFNQFVNLKELTFEFSLLRTIDPQFVAPASLTEMSFIYSQLTSISSDVFSNLANLQSMDLSSNQLQTLQEQAFDGLDNVIEIFLGGNQWNCDCNLQWLKDWLSARNLLDSSGATCASPEQAPFANVDFCPSPPKIT